jgi:hypothetical protein
MQHRLPVSPLRVPRTLFGAHRRRGGVKSPNITHLPLTYVGRNKVGNAKAHAYSVCCILAKLPVGNASFCCIRALSSLAIIAKSSRAQLASSIRRFKLLSLLASVVPTKISSGPSTFCKGAGPKTSSSPVGESDTVSLVMLSTRSRRLPFSGHYWRCDSSIFISQAWMSREICRYIFKARWIQGRWAVKDCILPSTTSALKYQEFAQLR